MRVRYDLFKCWLLTSYGFQLLTSQIVYPPPPCALSPISTLQGHIDCCCVYCTFTVENWESYQAYGRLFNWKRVELTFLHLKHMWGSAVTLFPLWESLPGLLAHYLFGCVLIREGCDMVWRYADLNMWSSQLFAMNLENVFMLQITPLVVRTYVRFDWSPIGLPWGGGWLEVFVPLSIHSCFSLAWGQARDKHGEVDKPLFYRF